MTYSKPKLFPAEAALKAIRGIGKGLSNIPDETFTVTSASYEVDE
jgi:hypothetical protein